MERSGFISSALLAVNPSRLVPRGSAKAGGGQGCLEDTSICMAGVIAATSSLVPCPVLTDGLLLAACQPVLGAREGKEVFR